MLHFLTPLQVLSGVGGASASKSFIEQYFGMTILCFSFPFNSLLS